MTQGGFKKSIFAVTSFVDDLLFRFIIESFDFGKNILKKYIHIAAEFKFKVEKWSKLPCLTVLINISTLTNFNLKTEDPTHSYFKHFFLLLFYSIVHIHDYKTFIFHQFPLISAKVNFIEICNPYFGIFMPSLGLYSKTQIMEF